MKQNKALFENKTNEKSIGSSYPLREVMYTGKLGQEMEARHLGERAA